MGASVTFAYVENLPSPGVGYDSTDPEDPVRRAILAGRTVASNAGFATAQVGDVQPGGTLTLPATGDAEVEVLVRWEQGFASDEPPDTITLVLGRVDPECVAPCSEIIRSAPAPPAAPGAEYGELLLTMTVPAHWTHAFLRVEVLRSVGDDDRRWGAFTSPVFLVRG